MRRSKINRLCITSSGCFGGTTSIKLWRVSSLAIRFWDITIQSSAKLISLGLIKTFFSDSSQRKSSTFSKFTRSILFLKKAKPKLSHPSLESSKLLLKFSRVIRIKSVRSPSFESETHQIKNTRSFVSTSGTKTTPSSLKSPLLDMNVCVIKTSRIKKFVVIGTYKPFLISSTLCILEFVLHTPTVLFSTLS